MSATQPLTNGTRLEGAHALAKFQYKVIAVSSAGQIPDGVSPGRFVSTAGYVILRWNKAPFSYEAYEHRFVMGFPDGHVHHKNGDTQDNSPNNLEVLSARDHGRIHRGITVTDEAIAAAFKERLGGESFVGLGRRLGVSGDHARRALIRLGLHKPTRQPERDREWCQKGLHRMSGDNVRIVGTAKHRRCRACLNSYTRRWFASQKTLKADRERGRKPAAPPSNIGERSRTPIPDPDDGDGQNSLTFPGSRL